MDNAPAPPAATDAVLATFHLRDRSAPSLAASARVLAEMGTTGPWHGATEPTPLFQRCRGEVVSVVEEGPSEGLVTIALPTENFDLGDGLWNSLFIGVLGGYTAAAACFEAITLVDLALPPSVQQAFPGPRFGHDGVWPLLDPTGGPVAVGAIVKPVSGVTPDAIAADVLEAAQAGLQFVKDDEKMFNPPYCPLLERVRTVEAALARVADGTGWRPLYAPNITTRTDRIVDQARRAIEAGARALTVTFVSSNLEALWCLAASDEVAVPIYAHCTGKEIFTGAPGDSRGIAPAVLARLVRLLGGDIMRLSAVDGDLVYSDRPTMAAMHRAMTDDALARPAMLPVVSGALNPGNVHRSLAVTGPRVLLLAGRALVGHPEGPAAGVRAFRAAVEAFLEPNPDAKPPTGGAIPS